MADLVSYQLINNTGSQLNLVGTFPTNWSGDTVPTTLPVGAQQGFTNHTMDLIVFGYEVEGYLAQYWVMSYPNNSGSEVGTLGNIKVDTEGDSEDGWVVTLTYQ